MGWLWDTIRWTDGLDIALMAFIMYRAILLLRGTRAIQTLLGLGLLLAIYIVSDALELVSIHWLLDKFVVYIVLAVIILFQQDIRKGLAGAGGRLFLGGMGRTTAGLGMVEELVQSAFHFASTHRGALIAIERGASLQEYVAAGAALDAVIGQDLLRALFHPSSPLHDGAVIVQKGRLAAAKVVLPLTQRQNVSKFYGTRHRAAIGLTEETDAVVIVVSEERGTVGLAVGGAVLPAPDANTLRDLLLEHLGLSRKSAGPAAAPAAGSTP